MSPPVQELPTEYKLVHAYCLPLTRSAGTCPRPTEADTNQPPVQELPSGYKLVCSYRLPLTRSA